jgi:SAM-dependent methyltransferase
MSPARSRATNQGRRKRAAGVPPSKRELARFVASRVWYQSYEFLEPFGIEALSDSDAKFRALDLPDLAGKTVLDLGCNAGYMTFKALELGARVAVGVDWDEGFIETACAIRDEIRRRPEAIFFRSEALHFLLELRSSFDIIICASIGHYLDLPGVLRALETKRPELLAIEIPYVPGSDELHVSRKGRIVIPGERALARLAKGHGFRCERRGESERLDGDERAVFHLRR